jgi:hypothetical protein
MPALVRTLLGVGWCDLLSNTVEFLRNGLAWSASQMSGRCAALLTCEMLGIHKAGHLGVLCTITICTAPHAGVLNHLYLSFVPSQ